MFQGKDNPGYSYSLHFPGITFFEQFYEIHIQVGGVYRHASVSGLKNVSKTDLENHLFGAFGNVSGFGLSSSLAFTGTTLDYVQLGWIAERYRSKNRSRAINTLIHWLPEIRLRMIGKSWNDWQTDATHRYEAMIRQPFIPHRHFLGLHFSTSQVLDAVTMSFHRSTQQMVGLDISYGFAKAMDGRAQGPGIRLKLPLFRLGWNYWPDALEMLRPRNQFFLTTKLAFSWKGQVKVFSPNATARHVVKQQEVRP